MNLFHAFELKEKTMENSPLKQEVHIRILKCNKQVSENYFVSIIEINQLILISGGRDNSVGIATRYGLDGPGIESR